MVTGFNRLFALLVVGSVSLSVVDHFLDLLFAKPARCRDLYRLFLSGAKILSRHMNNSISINIERDFDLRDAARRHRNSDEIKLAEQFVIRGHFPLSLEDSD